MVNVAYQAQDGVLLSLIHDTMRNRLINRDYEDDLELLDAVNFVWLPRPFSFARPERYANMRKILLTHLLRVRERVIKRQAKYFQEIVQETGGENGDFVKAFNLGQAWWEINNVDEMHVETYMGLDKEGFEKQKVDTVRHVQDLHEVIFTSPTTVHTSSTADSVGTQSVNANTTPSKTTRPAIPASWRSPLQGGEPSFEKAGREDFLIAEDKTIEELEDSNKENLFNKGFAKGVNIDRIAPPKKKVKHVLRERK